jgi:hypothetical protein
MLMMRVQNDLKIEDPKDFSLGIFFGIVALPEATSSG